MKPFIGILKILIGLIQATGAILYLVLAFGVGFQHQTHLVGGFLVVITLLSLALFGWSGGNVS